MDRPCLDHRPARHERRPDPRGLADPSRLDGTVMGANAPDLALQQADGRVLGGAEPGGALRDRVQDRLHVGRGP